MKRLLLAAGLAVAIHAIVLGAEPMWLKSGVSHRLEPRVVTLTLSYYQPQRPKTKPSEKRPQKPQKKAVTAPRKERQKQSVQPRPEPPLQPKKPDMAEEPSYNTPDFSADILEEQEPEETGKMVSLPPGSVIREARPIYRNNPRPQYPRLARKRGYEGTVVLEVLVDERGRVGDLRVFTSSGYTSLDRAAVASVEKWLFEPGARGDESVAMWVRIPVRFELK